MRVRFAQTYCQLFPQATNHFFTYQMKERYLFPLLMTTSSTLPRANNDQDYEIGGGSTNSFPRPLTQQTLVE